MLPVDGVKVLGVRVTRLEKLERVENVPKLGLLSDSSNGAVSTWVVSAANRNTMATKTILKRDIFTPPRIIGGWTYLK
jgi:hypothetical protein